MRRVERSESGLLLDAVGLMAWESAGQSGAMQAQVRVKKRAARTPR